MVPKYSVARTELDALVKSTTKIFSNFVAFSENPNFKVGKAATLSKFSDTLTLFQTGGADYAQPLALPHLNFFVIMPLQLGDFVKTFGLLRHLEL